MQTGDLIKLALHSVFTQRMRSMLTALGIAVGIASVVLLTSIGEGVHRYVLAEFTQFGTNLIGINPGKATTTGMSGAIISNIRPLTIEDAEALAQIPYVVAATPLVQGNAAVEYGKKSRRTYVFGVGPDTPKVWQIPVASGLFLPSDDLGSERAFAVLGHTLKKELFGIKNPLGKRIRIGGERFRVIGIMESKGQMLGFDLDDTVYIPVGRALSMFDRDSLIEIDLLYMSGVSADRVSRQAKKILMARHGAEDFTITTQEQMLKVLGSVLNVITVAVGALGGISLLVGGVGILTIMTIAVNERTSEVGLLCAIGARRRQILALFICEAVLLSCIGGLAGLGVGVAGAWLLGIIVPALPTHTSWAYIIAAEALAAFIGLGAGVLPARHAARLNPVEALRAE
jgi:putative ABC transport system permease protein